MLKRLMDFHISSFSQNCCLAKCFVFVILECLFILESILSLIKQWVLAPCQGPGCVPWSLWRLPPSPPVYKEVLVLIHPCGASTSCGKQEDHVGLVEGHWGGSPGPSSRVI